MVFFLLVSLFLFVFFSGEGCGSVVGSLVLFLGFLLCFGVAGGLWGGCWILVLVELVLAFAMSLVVGLSFFFFLFCFGCVLGVSIAVDCFNCELDSDDIVHYLFIKINFLEGCRLLTLFIWNAGLLCCLHSFCCCSCVWVLLNNFVYVSWVMCWLLYFGDQFSKFEWDHLIFSGLNLLEDYTIEVFIGLTVNMLWKWLFYPFWFLTIFGSFSCSSSKMFELTSLIVCKVISYSILFYFLCYMYIFCSKYELNGICHNFLFWVLSSHSPIMVSNYFCNGSLSNLWLKGFLFSILDFVALSSISELEVPFKDLVTFFYY